jgi:hypothetical protein
MNLQIVTNSLFDLSKKQIQALVKNTIQQEDLAGNVLANILKAKKAEEFFKNIQEELKKDALKEAEKHPERVVEAFGAKFEKTSVHTEYDFSSCNDPEYKELVAQYETLMNKLQGRKEFLKALREPLTIVDENTGEISKIHPAVKKTTDGIKITY